MKGLEVLVFGLVQFLWSQGLKIGIGARQAFRTIDGGRPTQHFLGPRDIGAALLRVVFGQLPVDNFLFRTSQRDDLFREIADGDFVRVADVDWTGFVRKVQPVNAFYEVIDITETAGLAAVAEDGEVFTASAWPMNAGSTRPSFKRMRGP